MNFVADDFSRTIPHVRKPDVTEANISPVVASSVDVDLSNPAADGPIVVVADDVSPYITHISSNETT